MNFREKTVCFTGHREIRSKDLNLYSTLYNTLENLILQGFLYFGAGGARGFDTMAAEVVLALKDKYPQIYLILVLPFKNQYLHAKGWRSAIHPVFCCFSLYVVTVPIRRGRHLPFCLVYPAQPYRRHYLFAASISALLYGLPS